MSSLRMTHDDVDLNRFLLPNSYELIKADISVAEDLP